MSFRLPQFTSIAAWESAKRRRSKFQGAVLAIYKERRRLQGFDIELMEAWRDLKPRPSTLRATMRTLYELGLLVKIGEYRARTKELESVYTLREYLVRGQKYLGVEHEHRCVCSNCKNNHLDRRSNRKVRPVRFGYEEEDGKSQTMEQPSDPDGTTGEQGSEDTSEEERRDGDGPDGELEGPD